jgi:hypothetical protein
VKKTGERGRPLAIAGIALAAVQIITLAILVPTVFLKDDKGSEATPTPSPSESATDEENGDPGREVAPDGEGITVFDIAVGDCFDTSGLSDYQGEEGGSETDVTLYPCDVPHEAEAFGSFEVTGYDSFPGMDEMVEIANAECNRLVQPYILDTWTLGEDTGIFYYHPEEASWSMGDREILCFFGLASGRSMSESLRPDESALSADALGYLEITGALDTESWMEPAEDSGVPAFRSWGDAMASVIEDEIAALSAATWSDAELESLIGELVDARESSLPYWQDLADAGDEAAVWENYEQGYGTLGIDTEIEIRSLLGLATGS